MENKKISLLAVFLYILVMGIGMAIMHYGVGYSYSKPEMVKVIIFAEIIMTIITIFIAKKYFGWEKVGFKKINTKGLMWFTPHLLIIGWGSTLWIIRLFSIAPSLTSSQWLFIFTVCITTMLVGFSEEVMFRGIVLNAFKSTGSTRKAIIVSAAFFSLLHGVNVFGGVPLKSIHIQLINTFIMGLCFAPLAIKTQNLWPLIIFHWLWDLIIVSAPIIGFTNLGFSILGSLLNLILAIILWINFRKLTINSRV